MIRRLWGQGPGLRRALSPPGDLTTMDQRGWEPRAAGGLPPKHHKRLEW
jgi:hypothetical protein